MSKALRTSPATRRIRTVAAIVGVLSVGWAAIDSTNAGSASRLLTYTLGTVGVIVASGLWRNRLWARRAYWVWAAAALGRFVIQDVRAEPMLLKVIAAAVIAALGLLGLGMVVRSARGN